MSHRFVWDDLEIGQSASITKTVTDEDLARSAVAISRELSRFGPC